MQRIDMAVDKLGVTVGVVNVATSRLNGLDIERFMVSGTKVLHERQGQDGLADSRIGSDNK
jgi:hypothetical protein